MFLNRTVPEQSSEERQRVIRQRAVHERLLSIERLDRAAARAIILNRGVYQLREQFGSGPQTLGRPPITPIQWLPEHHLAATAVVPEIEPVAD